MMIIIFFAQIVTIYTLSSFFASVLVVLLPMLHRNYYYLPMRI